jgi:hypothetical protein
MDVQKEVHALLNPKDADFAPDAEAAWNKLYISNRVARGMGTSLYPQEPADLVARVDEIRSILSCSLNSRYPGRYLAWKELQFKALQLRQETWQILGPHNSTVEPIAGHLFPLSMCDLDYVKKRLSSAVGLLVTDCWEQGEEQGERVPGFEPVVFAVDSQPAVVYSVYEPWEFLKPEMPVHQRILRAAGAVWELDSLSTCRIHYGSETFASIRVVMEHMQIPVPPWERASLSLWLERWDALLVSVIKAYLRREGIRRVEPVLPAGLLVPMLAAVYNERPRGELASSTRLQDGWIDQVLNHQRDVHSAAVLGEVFDRFIAPMVRPWIGL